MSAWTSLVQPEYHDAWDRFERQFRFKPSCPADGPGILEPVPSVTFDLNSAVPPVKSDDPYYSVVDLHVKAYATFQRVTPIGKSLIVLDWKHDEYLFDPHAQFDAANWREWKTWVYPDGDYYIFLAEDFRYGTFGHPWAGTICVWGQELIDAFADDPPILFQRVVRRDGVAAQMV